MRSAQGALAFMNGCKAIEGVRTPFAKLRSANVPLRRANGKLRRRVVVVRRSFEMLRRSFEMLRRRIEMLRRTVTRLRNSVVKLRCSIRDDFWPADSFVALFQSLCLVFSTLPPKRERPVLPAASGRAYNGTLSAGLTQW